LFCSDGTFGGALCIEWNQRASWPALNRFGPMTGVCVVTAAAATCGDTADVTTAPVNEVQASASATNDVEKRRERVIGGSPSPA
jgi:hypothetical protein